MLSSKLPELVAKLSEMYGPSGYEDEVRSSIIEVIKSHNGKPEVDSLGNVFAEIKGTGNGPRIMVSAHMDEVGFMIKHVEETGHLRFVTLGSINPVVMPSQRILIRGAKPQIGVIGSKPPHIMSPDEAKKPVEVGELYIDIGARSRAEVNQLGIDVGSTGVFDVPFKKAANSMVIGKALDNRVGCAVALKMFESFSAKPASATVIFALTVQEELGMRGATVAANRIAPDAALVFESAVAADSPDVRPKDRLLIVGSGPAIRILDNSMVTQRLMLEHMRSVAESHGIQYQRQINMGGATDAGKIHLSGRGVPTGVLSTPCRYLHSPSLMLSLTDVENLLNLAEHTIRDIKSPTVFNYPS